MSKTFLRRLFVLALCACLVLLAVLPAGADFGDYSGDSDYGSSSDWSSSDSDWDWSSSDSDYSSSSESSGGISTIVVGAIIVFIAIVSTSRTKKKKGASGGTSWSAAANRKLKPMAEYEQLDENFDKAELTSKLSNLYVQMQDCWQKKDISPIRPYCTDAFFTQMDNQIQRKKQQGQTNYIERIAVLSVELRGWCQEGGNDVLVARLNTRIVDYTLDDKTRRFVEPRGIEAYKITGLVSYVLCERSFTSLFENIAKDLRLKEVEYVSSIWAEGMSLLSEDKRYRRQLIADVGYITSSVAVVQGDGLVSLTSFSLGGGHVASDIAMMFEAPFSAAEEVKDKIDLSLAYDETSYYEAGENGIEQLVKKHFGI